MAAITRDGQPGHGTIQASIEALAKMVHRSGDVDGEGDGCGLQIDVPRRLWADLLRGAGMSPDLATDPRFAVGHLFIARSGRSGVGLGASTALKDQLIARMETMGFQVLTHRSGCVTSEVLGPRARKDEPEFWQVAVLAPGTEPVNQVCYHLAVALEEEPRVHVLSFSGDSVVYKVRGDAVVLRDYFPDLRDPRCESRMAIGHNRYSTNTATVFERVQPFALLGHNGEINTIRQLRQQAVRAGIPLTRGGSDSQDLNRTVEGLLYDYGISLFEAMEMVFPPTLGEIKGMRPSLQDLYMYYRQAWGPFAQGPAAIAVRAGDEFVASVDAMGLRPFWLVETEPYYFFSSEPGIVPAGEMTRDPRPLAPGEKVGVLLKPNAAPELLPYTEMQRRVLKLSRTRFPEPELFREFIAVGGPTSGHGEGIVAKGEALPAFRGGAATEQMDQPRLLSVTGWSGEDVQGIQFIAQEGNEPMGSLGFDGPLACLASGRQNLADYFKESVAVVTNPAVDREREIEHFSTRSVIGYRPPLRVRKEDERTPVFLTRAELRLPVLLGGHRHGSPLPYGEYRDLAHRMGTWVLEDLVAAFPTGMAQVVETAYRPGESLAMALERISGEAVHAVADGAQFLLIDDAMAFDPSQRWIDPHLALSTIDRALVQAEIPRGEVNLRRRTSLVLRSGAIRSLHDIALAVGLGADAVNPYLMLELAAEGGSQGLENLVTVLVKGLEKVISTLGMHELRGYARCFSHIGLRPEVAAFFGCEGYMGSESAGLSLTALEADADERFQVAQGERGAELSRFPRFWPRLWKPLGDAAGNPALYPVYQKRLAAQEADMPVSLRHLLQFRKSVHPVAAGQVIDTTIEDYRYPLTISGMSFGSQGETAFRAYAEAARRLDIVCMNGEGGEIPDMVGRFFKWRGQQVASGRFGVHAEMLAGSRFIEIKVGQGAKPGEGGHLPGSKVTSKVARARNAATGVDLISPSNNHDVYSIEDLAELVEELKVVNPMAKIVVKVPVVPGIGTIAVGVAKAGADIIALCGYDGGTGAARKHAQRHAGLPIEIGVREAHVALVASGIRDRVEVWGDSGMKSGTDVVKLMLLGANRVGFATLPMVSIGCTICRGCQKDTCHVGIATQIESDVEAKERGLKSFVPRVYDEAVERLVSIFTTIGEEVRQLTGELGFARAQDLVGHAELLEQVRGTDRVDLEELVAPLAVEVTVGAEASSAPVRSCAATPLTREITAMAAVRLEAGEAEFSVSPQQVTARDRIIGTHLAGEVARTRIGSAWTDDGPVFRGLGAGLQLPRDFEAQVLLNDGSVAGNGLAAWNTEGVTIQVSGGAQDGVGKGMLGGKVVVLKSQNRFGEWVGGSVGKSFAYGAQKGLFLVQGGADSRCGIRLSGADLVIGGQLSGPVDDNGGSLATRANLKGFAFEYMTRGRAVVLGDPGPWICSGMTGGVVYVRLQPEWGLDEAAIVRRLAKGAKVHVTPIGTQGQKDLTELLGHYHRALLESGQSEAAGEVLRLTLDLEQHFRAILPESKQVDERTAAE